VGWRRWVGRGDRGSDQEIREEIESHLRLAARDRIDRGESAADARRRASIELGNAQRIREETRAVWRWTALEQLAADLQMGFRVLWRAPAFAATAVFLIALVVGGNTTVYAVVHAVLSKPAPGIQATGLVTLGWIGARGDEHPGNSYANYLDVAAASKALKPVLAFAFEHFILTAADGSYAMDGELVSRQYFDTLAVRPALGRTFTGDESAGRRSGLVALISDRLWHEHFDGSADAIGAAITLNSLPATIVGVVPPAFHGVFFGESADVWVPLEPFARAERQDAALHDRRDGRTVVIGRLAPGVSLTAAQGELTSIAHGLERADPVANRSLAIRLFPYSGTAAGDSIVAQRGPWFLAMFQIITALTLLLVCANVANLMLARAVVRAREMAVRQSFGASRLRLVRIFASEGLAIAVGTWIVATLVAAWLTRALPRLVPPLDGAPSRTAFDFTPDPQVLLYALLLAILATIFFSTVPAVWTTRQDLQPLLKIGAQGIVAGRSTMSNALVVLQLALSVLLMTSAGLAYRSLSVLTGTELGFDRDHLILITVNTKAAATTPQANVALLSRMVERLRHTDGIAAASYARSPIQSYWRPEQVRARPGGDPIAVEGNDVGPGYLSSIGVAPRLGRDLEANRSGGSPVPVVINARLAERLWPGDAPIGRSFVLGSKGTLAEVAAVVPNGFYNGYSRDTEPDFVFVAAERRPPPPGSMTLYVSYRGPLDRIVPAIGAALRSVDDRAPIVYARTVEEQLLGLTWPARALTVLLAVFALGSLLVAAIGQYATMSFTMRRRIRDFGIRMALGASSADVLAAVVREGFRLTAAGLAIGLALSAVTGRGLRSFLYGVSPGDARTYAGVLILLTLGSLAACLLPAYRASRVDPMQALRDE
jgi:predicted permease